jgi:alkaline phosphatase D
MKKTPAKTAQLLFLLFMLNPCLTHPPVMAAPPKENQKPPKRIAFGSCHVQHFPHSPIWENIQKDQPDLVLLLGDNVYIDSYKEEKHQAAYQKLKSHPEFLNLLKTTPILAIWDDHDYGRNDDGGAQNPTAEMAQRVFLEAFNVPKDRGPWKRKGLYDSYLLGNQTQILLLDTRSFRSPLQKHPDGKRTLEGYTFGRYLPHSDTKTTLLGPEQWAWLEEELKKPAALRLIASSIQVLSNEHGWECWGNFPHERKKLLDLLSQTEGTTVLLSGDRHLSEVSQIPTKNGPLVEITSSPLLSKTGPLKEKNPFRISGPLFQENYALLEIRPQELLLTFKSPKGKTLLQHPIPHKPVVETDSK